MRQNLGDLLINKAMKSFLISRKEAWNRRGLRAKQIMSPTREA